jgi:hypothetical protein
MSHPDTDRLIDLVKDPHSDPEVLAHLQTCQTCRTRYELLQETAVVLRPGPPTPKYLVDHVMAAIPSPSSHPWKVTPGSLVWSGALGGLTTLLTLSFTGSLGAGGPGATFLLTVLVALGSAFAQKRRITLLQRSRAG